MSENRSPEEDYREFVQRMEREFQPRILPPEEPAPTPYRDPAAQPPYVEPQPQRFSFSLAPTRPRAAYVLLVINIVMYGITVLLSRLYGGPVQLYDQLIDPFTVALVQLGAKVNALIDAGQWWRLLTPMVLHGNLLHLAFNSWALYALGPQVESTYGTPRFLAIYGLAGLSGSIASYAFNPQALSVGASGAIFGLFGALAAFAYTSRSLIGWEAAKMQLGQMASVIGINLMFGFLNSQIIDNWAHIGGLAVGGLLGLAIAPRYGIDRRSYPPTLARRDSVLFSWGVAGITLMVLIGWFLFTRMQFGA